MKPILLSLLLSLITFSLSAQVRNKKYDICIIQNSTTASRIGAFLRNDTLFIEPEAIVNVLQIHSEDSTWKTILLAPLREKKIAVKPKAETAQQRLDRLHPIINTSSKIN